MCTMGWHCEYDTHCSGLDVSMSTVEACQVSLQFCLSECACAWPGQYTNKSWGAEGESDGRHAQGAPQGLV